MQLIEKCNAEIWKELESTTVTKLKIGEASLSLLKGCKNITIDCIAIIAQLCLDSYTKSALKQERSMVRVKYSSRLELDKFNKS